jgi:uncharacterized protein
MIQSYGAGAFVVNGQRYETSVFLTAEATQAWDATEVSAESIATLLPACTDIEILLVGSGKTQVFISPAMRRLWREQYQIAVEVMDTGAACRTYNVLLAEDRPVAAAILRV